MGEIADVIFAGMVVKVQQEIPAATPEKDDSVSDYPPIGRPPIYRAEYGVIEHGAGVGVRLHSNRGLSKREWEVMLLICHGNTPAQIAKELGLSTKTISTYRERILNKTGATNNVELALMAFRQGLVE